MARRLWRSAVIVALSVSLAAPAYAQLTPDETAIKQSLEQKAKANGLDLAETQLYAELTKKEIPDTPSVPSTPDTKDTPNAPDAFETAAKASAGHTIGMAGGFLIVALSAGALCVLGVFVACPLMAVGVGG